MLILIMKRVQEHGGDTIIPFSCALEKMLVDMPEDEAAKYCQQNNIQRCYAYLFVLCFYHMVTFHKKIYILFPILIII